MTLITAMMVYLKDQQVIKETYNPTADFNGNSQVISVSKYSITCPHNLIQSLYYSGRPSRLYNRVTLFLHRGVLAASLGGACGQGYNEVRQSLKLSPYWKSVFSSNTTRDHTTCTTPKVLISSIVSSTVVSQKRAHYRISAHPPLLLQLPAKV